MDDKTGQKKSTYLVRNLLLGSGRNLSWFLLLGLLIASSPARSSHNKGEKKNSRFTPHAHSHSHSPTCDSTSAKKVTCFEYHPKLAEGRHKQVSVAMKYKNGLRHGVWHYYHADGTLDRRIKYRKGERRWTYIYSDDKIAVTIDRNGVVRKKRECDCY